MSQAVEAYKQAAPAGIKIHGKDYTLCLGLPKSPERRKRNQILRMLADHAEECGANNVTIDWWNGDILSQKKRMATVTEETSQAANIHFVKKNPVLEEEATLTWLREQQRVFRSHRDWD